VAGKLLVYEEALFGPMAPIALPVVRTKPLSMGKAGFELVKYPIFPTGVFAKPGAPFIVILKAVTPEPNNTPFTNCAGVSVLVTTIGWDHPCNVIIEKNRSVKISFIDNYLFHFVTGL
jgi:hypothetical protein